MRRVWSKKKNMYPALNNTPTASSGYVSKYGCTCCANLFTDNTALKEFIVDKFYRYSDNKKVDGWNFSLHLCPHCIEQYGEPTAVYSRPHETGYATFTNHPGVIELKLSGPSED
jgi:hypothetical protein